MPPSEVGVRENLMLLINSHILKMAAMLKPSAEYNRRAAIIEDLRAGRSATEIIRFFGYPRSTVYDVVAKYTALEQSNEGSSMPARKSHSKERTARIPAVVERAQTLISDDPRQSLRKLASIVGVSEPTMRRIAEEDFIQIVYIKKALWGCHDKELFDLSGFWWRTLYSSTILVFYLYTLCVSCFYHLCVLLLCISILLIYTL